MYEKTSDNATTNGAAAGIKKYEIIEDGALAFAASSVVALAAVAHMGFWSLLIVSRI
mgnify:CR=1 FL=1